MIRALVAALLLAVLPVQAQTLLSGFISQHSKAGYCERNNGVGLRIDSGNWAGWALGTYRNSLCRQTVYVAREWLWQAGPVHLGVLAAAATGYRSPIMPAVLPEVVLRLGRVETALLIQPLQLKQSPAFAAIQLRYRF